jgi:hypothetical protein
MLRAGICDLGTCDLEMGWVAGPADRDAGRPVHPTPRTASSARERRDPFGARRRPAAGRAFGGWAGLLHFRPGEPLTCSVTVQRAMICRTCARRCGAFRRGGAVRFGPDSRGVSARDGGRFRPGRRGVSDPGRCGVSARDAPAFPPGRRQPAARPASGCRGAPVSYPRRATSRAPASFGCAMHFPGGPHATEWIQQARPRGDQPLTSGPARVRLIRRMTRRSRSMAAR